MRVTREQVAENRRRILDASARLFRNRGVSAVSVADVMQCAGLTHGGFYRYFSSKDDLVAQALAHILTSSADAPFSVGEHVERYLSAEHRDNAAEGCPFAALASEMRYQTPQARAVMTAGARQIIATLTSAMSPHPQTDERRAAIGSWAAMVGAMVIARVVDDEDLSDRILEETRRFLESVARCPGNVDPESGSSTFPASSEPD
ncbi:MULTISPECIES: TetR/AcrR family transcriptional regulator [unclassified Rhizobium]|uniref:TetR/AcrR family transcriptional regulator n=1 Tax=unclassified Rhizobium TaxID=2613769 RepID=UPI0009EC8BA1|nr:MULTISPECIES: TetR/AcrR family transcriptional regulator [unclassified Rhizobium]